VVTIIVLLPLVAAATWQLINKPEDITITSHFIEVGISVRNFLIRFVFGLAVLPYEAYKNTDAIVRTIWRLGISNRKLLEWTPSATTSRFRTNSLFAVFASMWIAPLLSILIIAVLIYFNVMALLVASPILILWLVAPAIAWYLSKEPVEKNQTSLNLRNYFFIQLHGEHGLSSKNSSKQKKIGYRQIISKSNHYLSLLIAPHLPIWGFHY
jgi:hypothetical protein